ncbi:MAG: ThiF family adenylyltransferase [Anaerococcus vaginalis]|nr:ThiF family adenylyltransferase [Anaerococcus vaginalis]MDD7766914.1 ThiF family adenylyltransferase [Anaerococcus vaginalis]
MELRDKILKRQNKNDNEIFEKAKVSILGCGGLGSNVAMILARAGIGEIFLYDFDKVEYSNLNRQNYKISDIGKEKVLATKKTIEETIPYTKISASVDTSIGHRSKNSQDTGDEQFEIADNRSCEDAIKDLKAIGMTPVFTDYINV